jgi:hypothetical protein
VNNECNIRYQQPSLKQEGVHELIERVKARTRAGRRLLVGTSYGGRFIPLPNVVKASDFVLIHGNGVNDPDGIARPEPPVEERRCAVAATVRASPGCQDGDGVHSTHEIQGRVGVAVEVVPVEGEIERLTEKVLHNRGQRQFAITGQDRVGPRERPGVIRAKGCIVSAQKDRHSGPDSPHLADRLDDAGIPVRHHGADENEVGFARSQELPPEDSRRHAVSPVSPPDRPESLRLRDLFAGKFAAAPIPAVERSRRAAALSIAPGGVETIDYTDAESACTQQ